MVRIGKKLTKYALGVVQHQFIRGLAEGYGK